MSAGTRLVLAFSAPLAYAVVWYVLAGSVDDCSFAGATMLAALIGVGMTVAVGAQAVRAVWMLGLKGLQQVLVVSIAVGWSAVWVLVVLALLTLGNCL